MQLQINHEETTLLFRSIDMLANSMMANKAASTDHELLKYYTDKLQALEDIKQKLRNTAPPRNDETHFLPEKI